MAHALRLEVVAEGIETQELYRLLRGPGCDKAQGYFLGRPVDSKSLTTRLCDIE